MTDSKIVRIWITAFTSLPNNVGGQGRRLIIAHFSTKRNTNEHIPPARGRKPLPMGEVALRSNDGEG